MIADADPAAEINPAHLETEAAQFDDELGDPLGSAPVRLQLGELRSDVHGEPDRLDAGELCREAVCGRRGVQFDAELVLPAAGRDLGVGLCVNIRIDAYRDRCDATFCAGDFA